MNLSVFGTGMTSISGTPLVGSLFLYLRNCQWLLKDNTILTKDGRHVRILGGQVSRRNVFRLLTYGAKAVTAWAFPGGLQEVVEQIGRVRFFICCDVKETAKGRECWMVVGVTSVMLLNGPFKDSLTI